MIVGRLFIIAGTLLSALFVLCIIASFMFPDDKTTRFILVCLVLLFFSIALCRLGLQRIKLIRNYKLYKNILSSNWIDSIDKLADAVNQPITNVQKNVKLMQDKNLFLTFGVSATQSASATPANNNAVAKVTIKCGSCGASNAISTKTGGDCEYCGSPLNLSTSKAK